MRHFERLLAVVAVLAVASNCAKGNGTSNSAGTTSGGGDGGSTADTTSTTSTTSTSTASAGGSGGATSSSTASTGATGGAATTSSTTASTSSTGGGPASSSATGVAHLCGDGMLDPGEECDGADLGGQTCQSLGYTSGMLACNGSCKLDKSGCSACHDGMIQPQFGEDCDFDAMNKPLILATCQSLGFMSPNNPGCDMTCHYDTTPCLCGNGMIDGAEACDGADLGGKTCASQGFTAGMLACNAQCGLVTSGCTTCGNGAVEQGEQCDDGNTMSGDGCSATCQNEVIACDPNGTYLITMGLPVSYSCCSGLVSVNVTGFIFSNAGATILSSPSNPTPMTGAATTCPSGSFSNTGSIPGGCTEIYSVSGSYVDKDTWTGLYSVSFSGAQCDCFNGLLGTPCVGQVFPITAHR
jgi:cysteine-rich repeat protein